MLPCSSSKRGGWEEVESSQCWNLLRYHQGSFAIILTAIPSTETALGQHCELASIPDGCQMASAIVLQRAPRPDESIPYQDPRIQDEDRMIWHSPQVNTSIGFPQPRRYLLFGFGKAPNVTPGCPS
jgi:hypothetical protein